jgi:hypothetical protein
VAFNLSSLKVPGLLVLLLLVACGGEDLSPAHPTPARRLIPDVTSVASTPRPISDLTNVPLTPRLVPGITVEPQQVPGAAPAPVTPRSVLQSGPSETPRPQAPEPVPGFTQLTPPPGSPAENCDRQSYPDVCIPRYPPRLDCKDIPFKRFKVLPPDPHNFDADKDGIGCET